VRESAGEDESADDETNVFCSSLRPLSAARSSRPPTKAKPKKKKPHPLLFSSSSLPLHPYYPHHFPTTSATIAWREEYKPDEITFNDIKNLNTGRLELAKDRDVDGRPLVFFRLR
jgi:hypothetical protein